jgi:hypothetical protein
MLKKNTKKKRERDKEIKVNWKLPIKKRKRNDR